MHSLSKPLGLLGVAVLGTAWAQTDAKQPPCKKMSDIYTGGKELCENMWDGAFEYSFDEDSAYTMWFFGTNPNAAISEKNFDKATINECHLDSGQHDGPPVRENAKFTECHPWKDAACCKHGKIETADKLLNGYGPEYRWDRCGKLSPECDRFFVQEACFYECEPAAGLYRKYPKAQSIVDILNRTKYNASQHSTGSWQMEKMPIKASYCDAWMDACKNDFFCAVQDGSYFSCAREHNYTVATPPPAPPAKCPDQDTAKSEALTARGDSLAAVVTLSLCAMVQGAWV